MVTAVITGASSGLGKEYINAIIAEYPTVDVFWLVARRKELLKEIADEHPDKTIAAISLDLSQQESLEIFEKLLKENEPEIKVLVNNAGISYVGVIQDTTAAEWDKIFGVNVRGAFLCSRAVTDRMIGAGGGSIINISSIWGEVGASCEVAYSASKAALIGFTRALSKELAPSGVRVNCISPGVIDTSMNAHLTQEELEELIEQIPMGRLGTGEDVAKACAYLAEAQYVTGVVLPVGGGFAK